MLMPSYLQQFINLFSYLSIWVFSWRARWTIPFFLFFKCFLCSTFWMKFLFALVMQQQQTNNFYFLITFFLSALQAGNGDKNLFCNTCIKWDKNLFCNACIKCPHIEFWSYLRYSGLNPLQIAIAFAIANSAQSEELFWCWVLTYLIVM